MYVCEGASTGNTTSWLELGTELWQPCLRQTTGFRTMNLTIWAAGWQNPQSTKYDQVEAAAFESVQHKSAGESSHASNRPDLLKGMQVDHPYI